MIFQGIIDFLLHLINILKNIALFVKKEDVNVERKDPIKEYENAYKDKYERMSTRELSEDLLKNLKNSILYETTPLGNLTMYYDNESESFIYYSNKSLPYKYLESACRKYTSIFDCKCLYVDMENELNEIKEKKENRIENSNKNKEDKSKKEGKKSLYLKPKKYNEKNKNKSRVTVEENKSKINKFKYNGRIHEFSFIKNNAIKANEKTKKNISFSEFKKRSNI